MTTDEVLEQIETSANAVKNKAYIAFIMCTYDNELIIVFG